MTLPGSQQSISFGQIASEFGYSNGTSVQLGNYRKTTNVGSLGDIPLDSGIPIGTNPIKASHLWGKKLNVAIVYNGGTRVNAKSNYDNNQVTVVGGYKQTTQIPSQGSGARVIINVSQNVGSSKDGQDYVALRTGSQWSNTNLELIIGPGAGIYGAGGNGGSGGGGDNGDGGDGGQGSSALGIEYPTTITNQGVIVCGLAGGGGGGGSQAQKASRVSPNRGCNQTLQLAGKAGGGGGGGGLGYPGGDGGSYGGDEFYNEGKTGKGGDAGSVFGAGGAGAGAIAYCSQDKCDAHDGNAGPGGNGGDLSNGAGGGGTGGSGGGRGGNAGKNGYAIIYAPGASYSWAYEGAKGTVAGGEVNGIIN